jgi:hypothetical protein
MQTGCTEPRQFRRRTGISRRRSGMMAAFPQKQAAMAMALSRPYSRFLAPISNSNDDANDVGKRDADDDSTGDNNTLCGLGRRPCLPRWLRPASALDQDYGPAGREALEK